MNKSKLQMFSKGAMIKSDIINMFLDLITLAFFFQVHGLSCRAWGNQEMKAI